MERGASNPGGQETLRKGEAFFSVCLDPRGGSAMGGRAVRVVCFSEGSDVSSYLLVIDLQGWHFPFLEKMYLFIPKSNVPFSSS